MAGLVLLACLLTPRAGADVLLIPLAPASDARSLADLRELRLALAGRGRIAGSWLVRATPGAVPVWPLLRRGLVPIAVPSMLCGPLSQ